MKTALKNSLVFVIEEIIMRKFFSFLPDKQFTALDYFIAKRKLLNLKQPKTFNEKLQWIKLYGGLEKYTEYVDKYRVRGFIRKSIGKKYLTPLIGAWDKFDDIDFDQLPGQFVLKATHGSGYVFICKDKTSLNIPALKKTVSRWLSINFYNVNREIQYKDCQPKIICEKYLEDEYGGLVDYKIYCFSGKPRFIEIHAGRFIRHKAGFLDINFHKLPISCPGYPFPDNVKKPDNLKEMIRVAYKLSRIFPFIRVDLYSVKNKIYFGELTFTPANGLLMYDPPEVDYQLGELIDLSKFKKNQNTKYNKLVTANPEIQAIPTPSNPIGISQ